MNWAADENHHSLMHGGESVDNYCDNCMSNLVPALRSYCVACEYEHFKCCDGFEQIFRNGHFCESPDYADGQVAMQGRSSSEESQVTCLLGGEP